MGQEAEYYRRYLDGDDEGIVLLIRDCKDGLILYLYGICKNIHDAEDYCEDTFVTLVTKRPVYNGKASFKTWLYRIARNICIDGMRRRRDTENVDDVVIADDSEIDELCARAEKINAVKRLVASLETDQREALYLVYYDEMTVAGAAKIMRKKPNAVHQLLFRAREKLRGLLEEEGITDEDV
jgi:RNA polymerase sigma-70 factor (ECF subfamily)